MMYRYLLGLLLLAGCAELPTARQVGTVAGYVAEAGLQYGINIAVMAALR
jgi:hypothetical protein